MLGSQKDIEDARKISSIFADISEESKMMAIVYLSALRDKEIADRDKQLQEAQRGGEGNGCGTFNSNNSSFDTSDINKIRFNSLCCVDGGKPLPATIRQGHAKAYRMVCKEVHTGFIQKILIVD